jgi:1-acyl-sn-glycerol-3-phosphate acyltransferase
MPNWNLQPAADLDLSLRDRRKSLSREASLLETFGHHLYWGTIRAYLRLYHRIVVTGQENLPAKPPFVVIANHASHLDAMVLAAFMDWRIRDCVFPIAAGDVFFSTPVVSFFASTFINALPMWRKNCGAHAMAQLRQRLISEPCVYILFPEGTRSRDGTMGAFKAGLGMLVAGTEVPVVPCHLKGTFEAMAPGRRFPLPSPIRMNVGKPVVFKELSSNRDSWQQIAQIAQQACIDCGEE